MMLVCKAHPIALSSLSTHQSTASPKRCNAKSLLGTPSISASRLYAIRTCKRNLTVQARSTGTSPNGGGSTGGTTGQASTTPGTTATPGSSELLESTGAGSGGIFGGTVGSSAGPPYTGSLSDLGGRGTGGSSAPPLNLGVGGGSGGIFGTGGGGGGGGGSAGGPGGSRGDIVGFGGDGFYLWWIGGLLLTLWPLYNLVYDAWGPSQVRPTAKGAVRRAMRTGRDVVETVEEGLESVYEKSKELVGRVTHGAAEAGETVTEKAKDTTSSFWEKLRGTIITGADKAAMAIHDSVESSRHGIKEVTSRIKSPREKEQEEEAQQRRKQLLNTIGGLSVGLLTAGAYMWWERTRGGGKGGEGAGKGAEGHGKGGVAAGGGRGAGEKGRPAPTEKPSGLVGSALSGGQPGMQVPPPTTGTPETPSWG